MANRPYTELVAIYNANGNLAGEISYIVGKLRGTAHCALCDISHGLLGEKKTFSACKTAFDMPLRTLHLDERDEDLRVFTEGKTPCVVGRSPSGWHMVLDSDALAACNKDVATFEATLRQQLDATAGGSHPL